MFYFLFGNAQLRNFPYGFHFVTQKHREWAPALYQDIILLSTRSVISASNIQINYTFVLPFGIRRIGLK